MAPTGDHVILIALGGYLPQTVPVKVTSGNIATVTAKLVPAGVRTGSVTVNTQPPGAELAIDDRILGHAPMTVDNLSEGNHSLTLS
jgi:hypothetical protein